MDRDHARRLAAQAFRDRAVRAIEAHATRQAFPLSIHALLLADTVRALPLTDADTQAALDRRDEQDASRDE